MWRTEFASALLKSAMGELPVTEAINIKHLNAPKFLYKYRRFEPRALQNIESNELWLSSPRAFNDPFDCAVMHPSILRYLGSMQTAVKAVTTPKVQLGPMHIGLSDAAELAKARLIEASYNHLVEAMTSHLGLCCFSASNESLLMWSHYADSHKGFCVEYESPLPEVDMKSQLFPIIYSNSIYHIMSLSGPDPLNTILYCCLLKSQAWEYENEWRLIYCNPPLTNKPITVNQPRAVYFGLRMSENDKSLLYAICQKKGIVCLEMALSTDGFGMTSRSYAGHVQVSFGDFAFIEQKMIKFE